MTSSSEYVEAERGADPVKEISTAKRMMKAPVMMVCILYSKQIACQKLHKYVRCTLKGGSVICVDVQFEEMDAKLLLAIPVIGTISNLRCQTEDRC